MVDFSLSDEQKIIQETVRKFAESEIRPNARAWENAGVIPAEAREQVQQLGFVPVTPPTGADADERDLLSDVIILEELAWGDAGAALALLYPSWSHDLARRAGFSAKALDAASGAHGASGSHGGQVGTLAHLDGTGTSNGKIHGGVVAALDEDKDGGWRLNGRKVLVPAVDNTDPTWILVTAGHGLFLVPGNAKGVTWEDDGEHLGVLACPTRSLTLTDVAIPRECGILAEDPRGWGRLWEPYRCGISAVLLGISRAALEHANAYAVEREAFGQPIAKFQSIAFMLADMAVDIECARLLLYRAAYHVETDADSERESLMALKQIHDASLRITEDAVQILGGHGYCQDHPVEMWMRDARTVSVYGGFAPDLDVQLAAMLPAA